MEELRDIVIQTLESKDILGKLRAQLRFNLLKVIDEKNREMKSVTSYFVENNAKKSFIETPEGILMTELIRDLVVNTCFHAVVNSSIKLVNTCFHVVVNSSINLVNTGFHAVVNSSIKLVNTGFHAIVNSSIKLVNTGFHAIVNRKEIKINFIVE